MRGFLKRNFLIFYYKSIIYILSVRFRSIGPQTPNTGAPGVFFFRSDTYSFREGIKPGALLIVDFGGTPVDGSLVLCVLEQEFRIMRLRLHPKRCLQELDKLDNFRAIPDDDEDGLEVRGVITHIVALLQS